MNILLWILQVLLALHTIMGAVWKFSNSEQNMTSLRSIPHGLWLGSSFYDFLCAACLLLPVLGGSFSILAPIGAAGVAAEMLFFCVVHLRSGEKDNSPLVYWLVVAAVCVFIAVCRFALVPLAG